MPVRSLLFLLLGLVVFWDAKKRGYTLENALLWGLGSAAFPPVAIVYLLWGRRRETPLPERRREPAAPSDPGAPVDVSAKVTCPRCKSEVPESFSRCPHCNTALTPLCPGCGEPLSRDSAACPRCGREKS